MLGGGLGRGAIAVALRGLIGQGRVLGRNPAAGIGWRVRGFPTSDGPPVPKAIALRALLTASITWRYRRLVPDADETALSPFPFFAPQELAIFLCHFRCGKINSGRKPSGHRAGIALNHVHGFLEIF